MTRIPPPILRWLVPALGVAPALGAAILLGLAGEPAGADSSATAVPDPAASASVKPAPLAIGADTLIRQRDRDSTWPDTIGVLLERNLPATGATSIDEYLLWLPPGLERGDRRWPVILYLHGRSLRGDNPAMLLRYGLPRELAEGKSIPFIVVAPQLHPPGNWAEVDRLDAILDEIERRYPVDRDRVYLTGYSMGGGGVWRMAFDHADRFAAAVPMAAHTPAPSAAWSRALRRLPMRVYHGTADDLVPYPPAVKMVDALRRAGGDVELKLIPGADHGELTRLYRDPALYAWLLEHRRR